MEAKGRRKYLHSPKGRFLPLGMSNFKNDIRLLLGLGAKDNIVSKINYYLIPAQISIEFAPHES
jgi:hypothetical protein